jgi:hypothetical protein
VQIATAWQLLHRGNVICRAEILSFMLAGISRERIFATACGERRSSHRIE